MKNYKVCVLKGDGIGPEITDACINILLKVAKKYQFKFTFTYPNFGGLAIERDGIPLPNTTLKECQKSDSVLLSAIGDPKFDNLERKLRPESGLLQLRAGLELFANIRPIKIFESLKKASPLKENYLKNVDLIVIRELTGGIYFGEPKGRFKINESEERAFNTMVYSTEEIKRISTVAFEIAQQRIKKVCSVDKSNVLDVSQLWRDEVINTSQSFKDIELSHMYVDNACMQLIRDPSQFDVILTGNLFGDIISDEASMISGSIGLLPSASIGYKNPGLFEPVHGSAPDISGTNKANPIAMIMSAAMMLRIGLKELEAADDLENAVTKAINLGFRTVDIAQAGETFLSCSEMGEKISEFI